RRIEHDESASGRLYRDLMFGAALAAHQSAQPVAPLGNELGTGELDDLVADESGITSCQHSLVGEALQRAIIELDLDRIDAVPPPSRAGRKLGDRLAHDRR